MSKLALFTSTFAIAGILGVAALATAADPPTPCVRKEFKTEMAKAACEKGGQPAAKDAMKQFQKDKKLKSCNQCHSKLAPNYELKADGLKQFTDLGGK